MGTPRFTPEFKEEAVRQVTERGYSVADVSERLGVSAHSLYKWVRSVRPDNSGHQAQDLLDVKWFTEFGHLNRGDMLTSEQHRCHNEKKKFQRRV